MRSWSSRHRTLAKRISLLAVTGLCATVAPAVVAGPANAAPFNLRIVNESGQDPANVYVMLHNNAGNAASLDGQLTDGVPKQLSAIDNSTVRMGDIAAGRLFVSYGAPVSPNQANDNSSTTRYDKVEFTNPGVANLTAVDFFSIPFSLQALDASGAATSQALSYGCYTSTVAGALRGIAPGAELDSGGQYVRSWSPGLFPQYFPSMAPYLASMAGRQITIDDRFDTNGPPAVHTAINYTGTFGADGSITLTGTFTPDGGTATTGQPVVISGANLNGISEQGIYTGNGDYTVGGNPAHVADNNQYSVIYRDVVAGFALGYWGGKYGNSVSQWKGQPDFAAARASSDPFVPYNEYASTIADYSTAYGYSFHDMGPTAVAVGLDSSVATLEMVIEPDNGPNVPGCVGSSTPSSPSKPAGPRAKVTIDQRLVRLDRRGRAPVKLTCVGDPCSGELRLDVVERIRERRRGRRADATRDRRRDRVRLRELMVGRSFFRLSEGQTRKVWVELNRRGKVKLRHARGHRMRVVGRAYVGPPRKQTITDKRAMLVERFKPRRHRR